MKIQKTRKKSKRPLFIIVAILVLLVVGAWLWVNVWSSNNNSDKPAESSNTKKDSSKDSKSSTRSSNETTPATPDSKTTPTNTDQTTSPATPSSGSKTPVEFVSNVNVSGGTVYIRGGINIPTQSGSCYATLKGPSGTTVRKDTTLLQNPSTTDCKTIQIPASELTKGTWSYTLNFESDQLQGASNAQTFTIN